MTGLEVADVNIRIVGIEWQIINKELSGFTDRRKVR